MSCSRSRLGSARRWPPAERWSCCGPRDGESRTAWIARPRSSESLAGPLPRRPREGRERNQYGSATNRVRRSRLRGSASAGPGPLASPRRRGRIPHALTPSGSMTLSRRMSRATPTARRKPRSGFRRLRAFLSRRMFTGARMGRQTVRVAPRLGFEAPVSVSGADGAWPRPFRTPRSGRLGSWDWCSSSVAFLPLPSARGAATPTPAR